LAKPFYEKIILANLKKRAFNCLREMLNYKKDKEFAKNYYLDSLLESSWQALQLNANWNVQGRQITRILELKKQSRYLDFAFQSLKNWRNLMNKQKKVHQITKASAE
jgi:hypothetical protein